VICKLLGVPDAEYDKLRGWTEAFLSVSQIPGPQIGRSMKEMTAYIEQLVEFKRENPGEDLVSAMIRVRDENDGSLTDYELHWWIRLLLLVGYETTATQIGGGVALLLSHPEQLAALKNDWGLIPQFTEEALRWKLVGSSVSMLRFAVADIEMDGYTIPAGTSVIPAVDSANQDPTVFENPERFDIRRTSNPHLTFSLGAHFCIGAALARLQVQIATERLLKRFPTLKLSVAATELRRQPGALLEGFISIPVEW
jgi:nocardicin N-oxygenase